MKIKAIILLVGLAACQSGSPYEREMASIARLKVIVDTALAQTNRIDSAAIYNTEQLWRRNLDSIAAYAAQYPSGIDSASLKLLGAYRQKVADAAWVRNHVKLLDQELKLSKEQLDNLYHDLSYNLIEADGVKEAFKLECAAADSAISRAERLKPMAQKVVALPEALEEKMDSLLKSMKLK